MCPSCGVGNGRSSARGLIALAGLALLTGCRFLTGDDGIDAVLTPTDDQAVISADDNGDGEAKRTRFSFDSLRKSDPQSKIGAAQHPKILAAYGGAYEDDRLEQALALITGELVAQSEDASRAYDITVLNSPTVNAFALPGGFLYVTRGLLALANDAAEVAAVLSHEMAHVSSNHGVKRSQQAKAVNLAERVATNVVTNQVAGQVAKASTNRRLAAFSQTQELQADAVGIRMLGKAGYDPYAAARFLESMDRFAKWRSALGGSSANDMSSSHPSTPRRVELAKRHARLIGPEGTGKRDRDRYLQGISGMVFGDTAKEGFIRGQRFAHVKLGITFTVPDGFELANRKKSVLAAGPNQQALRFDAVPTTGESANPVTYLKSGWVNGLDAGSVKPFKANGLSGATGRAQAGDWQFAVSVVKVEGKYYRFILAAPRTQKGVAATSNAIAKSFRRLTKADKARLKPLRVDVATVKAGDTVKSMARRMKGVARAETLFRALNELGPKDRLRRGDRVKLVL